MSAPWTPLNKSLWEFPGIVQHSHPLTQFELGASLNEDDDAIDAVFPLRISGDGASGMLLQPQGLVLTADWWRGRRADAMPAPIYHVPASVPRGDDPVLDRVVGFLLCGDDCVEKIEEPQAPCAPNRVRLFARRAQWRERGTVDELDALLKTFPATSHRYAVADVAGGSAIPLVTEVLVRRNGWNGWQIHPALSEVAWREDTGAEACFSSADLVLSDDDPFGDGFALRRSVVRSVGERVVLGREALVKACDYASGPGFQWWLKRRRHGSMTTSSVHQNAGDWKVFTMANE